MTPAWGGKGPGKRDGAKSTDKQGLDIGKICPCGHSVVSAWWVPQAEGIV